MAHGSSKYKNVCLSHRHTPVTLVYCVPGVIDVCVPFQAHAELQESMAVNQQLTLGGLQEASAKMMSQQAEAARYTADAARHIKEVSLYNVPAGERPLIPRRRADF